MRLEFEPVVDRRPLCFRAGRVGAPDGDLLYCPFCLAVYWPAQRRSYELRARIARAESREDGRFLKRPESFRAWKTAPSWRQVIAIHRLSWKKSAHDA